MPLTTHKYSNGEVTVVWQPHICIHSGVCARGLGEVFNPHRKPWVDLSLSETDIIKTQIEKCPSGALTYIIEIEEK
jgi:uncharacterized Fe-S cluster protein YjdI